MTQQQQKQQEAVEAMNKKVEHGIRLQRQMKVKS